jgi:hypothetical protein
VYIIFFWRNLLCMELALMASTAMHAACQVTSSRLQAVVCFSECIGHGPSQGLSVGSPERVRRWQVSPASEKCVSAAPQHGFGYVVVVVAFIHYAVSGTRHPRHSPRWQWRGAAFALQPRRVAIQWRSPGLLIQSYCAVSLPPPPLPPPWDDTCPQFVEMV